MCNGQFRCLSIRVVVVVGGSARNVCDVSECVSSPTISLMVCVFERQPLGLIHEREPLLLVGVGGCVQCSLPPQKIERFEGIYAPKRLVEARAGDNQSTAAPIVQGVHGQP